MLSTLKSNIRGCSVFESSSSSSKVFDENMRGDLGLGVVDLELGLLLGVLGDRSEQRNEEGVKGDKGGGLKGFDSAKLLMGEHLLLKGNWFLSDLFLW